MWPIKVNSGKGKKSCLKSVHLPCEKKIMFGLILVYWGFIVEKVYIFQNHNLSVFKNCVAFF